MMGKSPGGQGAWGLSWPRASKQLHVNLVRHDSRHQLNFPPACGHFAGCQVTDIMLHRGGGYLWMTGKVRSIGFDLENRQGNKGFFRP